MAILLNIEQVLDKYQICRDSGIINSELTNELVMSFDDIDSLRNVEIKPAILQEAPHKYNVFPNKYIIFYGCKGTMYEITAIPESMELEALGIFCWRIYICRFGEYSCLKQYTVHSRKLPVKQITSDLMQLTFEELDLYE